MCNVEPDGNIHMLIEYSKSRQFWKDVEKWIIQLGVLEYELTESNIILGDVDKDRQISVILPCAKVSIYISKMKENSFIFQKNIKTITYKQVSLQHLKKGGQIPKGMASIICRMVLIMML